MLDMVARTLLRFGGEPAVEQRELNAVRQSTTGFNGAKVPGLARAKRPRHGSSRRPRSLASADVSATRVTNHGTAHRLTRDLLPFLQSALEIECCVKCRFTLAFIWPWRLCVAA